MKTNHWGITIDSEVAITGVVSNNTPEWLNDEISNGVNLQEEEYMNSAEDGEPGDEEMESDFLEFESSPSDTILIGDWVQDATGQYEPDPEGEYSAIVRESETQVVQSKYTKRTALCSPCFPGQGDLDSTGPWLAYDLPPEIYGVQS